MSGPETEKVRYGRARLTVARSGPLTGDDRLGETLGAYENGEVRAGVVAMAYLRARVVDHSPSFRWRGARLSELIPLVTSVAADPEIEATTSRELAEELVRLRRLERPAAEAAPEPEAPPGAEAAPRRVLGRYPVPSAPAEPPPPPLPEPVPPSGPEPEEEPRPARPRPVTAQQRRQRLAALAVIGVLVAAVAIVVNHLNQVGDRYADEYREHAGPAAQEVADSMDAVYDSFDLYLSGYEPGLAHDAINGAREAIDGQRKFLDDLPDEPLIGGGDAVEEVDSARTSGEEYLAESERFLDAFAEFVDLDPGEAEADARRFYERTIGLAEQAEALEAAIFSLGTGEGDPEPTDHYRPATPDSIGA